MDDHPNWPAGAHHDRGPDVDASLDEPVAGPRAILLGRFAHYADKLALAAAGAEFRADAEQGRKDDAL